MNPISLEPLTIFETAPPDLVTIAAATGSDMVSLWVHAPVTGLPMPPLVGDTPMRRETARRLADTGVKVCNLECFNLGPDTKIADYRPALESGAWLGAKTVTCIAYGSPDPNHVRDLFVEFAQLAGEFGLRLNVEFVSTSNIKSLGDTHRLVTSAGQTNTGITVDLLHLIRTGGSPADLMKIDPGLIGHAQLCDGPPEMPEELRDFEGFEERQIPGQGSFPVADFIAALPPHVPVGAEVPIRSMRERGIGPAERARLIMDATRTLVAARRQT